MKPYCRYISFLLFASAPAAVNSNAQASVVINGTRIIYAANKKEVTATVTNKNKTPVLIQSWIDTGNTSTVARKEIIPFVITPPINRVDPGKGQTLRISYLGSPALPADKESVFWINVLEIPAKNKNISEDQSQLNIAFNSRVKLFYRPSGLPGNAFKAPELLKWSINDSSVTVTNPTPFHVSLTSITYEAKGGKHTDQAMMIAPGQTQKYSFRNAGKIKDLKNISFTIVNDYGASAVYNAAHH